MGAPFLAVQRLEPGVDPAVARTGDLEQKLVGLARYLGHPSGPWMDLGKPTYVPPPQSNDARFSW